jgi:hypothetical protein
VIVFRSQPNLLLITIVVIATVVLGSCSTASEIESTQATDRTQAMVSSSAKDAVTELLGDIEPVDLEPIPTLEPLDGVAYSDDEIGVIESSVDYESNLLQIRLQGLDGKRVNMKNGGAIRLTEGLVAEIFVDLFPVHTLTAWLDLFLHDGSGKPVTGSKVVIDYDMYSMGHGPFFSLADKSPNGHYTFRLDYVMFGPWIQLLEVRNPETDETFHLEVVIVAVP